jgi:hypothetical protein
MYALNVIVALNETAARAPKRETETTRHCSYAGDATKGIVLHSARRRSTAWLTPRKAKLFLAEYLGTNAAEKRDELIESYFDSSPGKGLNPKHRDGKRF